MLQLGNFAMSTRDRYRGISDMDQSFHLPAQFSSSACPITRTATLCFLSFSAHVLMAQIPSRLAQAPCRSFFPGCLHHLDFRKFVRVRSFAICITHITASVVLSSTNLQFNSIPSLGYSRFVQRLHPKHFFHGMSPRSLDDIILYVVCSVQSPRSVKLVEPSFASR